ncbi:50S ribosomal protein L6 [Parcubacteria bacterium DG_74_2]|nr:MAG: 50S ribosomal protein L6 [Parcubacteria bacterium DG_74_2]
MSRIGKKPIEIPDGVEAKIEDGKVTIKGPKGELSKEIRPEIKIEVKDKKLYVFPKKEIQENSVVKKDSGETKQIKAFWGLFRAFLANMIKGVTEGFEKKLEIQGLGYKASLEGNDLILNIGFSHQKKIEMPEGIELSIEKNIITVSGIDKELVGQVAAKIRKVRPPEPYKGKGIRYVDEVVRKKVGKKATTAE